MKLDNSGNWETEDIPVEDAIRILTEGLNETKNAVIQLASEVEKLNAQVRRRGQI